MPWMIAMLQKRVTAIKLVNGTVLVDQSYFDCMKTAYNIRVNASVSASLVNLTTTQINLYQRCQTACKVNPVKFAVSL
jgi:hypothetical protein